MRSRYSAFRRGNTNYILKSWATETRPKALTLDPGQEWLRLTVEHHEMTDSDTAIVRFTAIWRQDGQEGKLSETSRFRRNGEGWVYIDGTNN